MSDYIPQGNRQAIRIFTIGFSGKSAKEFFEILQKAGVKRVADIRLNNVSQLAGFTKKKDLEYFLQAIAGIKYTHMTELSPTEDILDDYKKKKIGWEEYVKRFNQLLQDRNPIASLKPEDFDQACLLCSETKPEKCHRRLVAEYFRDKWGNVVIKHL